MRLALTLLSLLALAAPPAYAAPARTRYVLVTPVGTIGSLTVDATRAGVDTDWRVDDNGRGAKITEHVELGPDARPRRWDITGKAWFGAPVKETFRVAGGRARWTSLDDAGEAGAKDALYLANNGSPWAMGLYLKVLLRAKGHTHAALPAGTLRLEKLRDVVIGAGATRETLTAYALWGLDVTPQFVLARKDHLVGYLFPGWVLVEERHEAAFPALSALAAELSSEALAALTRRVTHRPAGPLWITNVRVFDPATGTVGAPTNVGIFRDTITVIGRDAPPADAAIVDGAGATLLPGLFDAHAHLSHWDGPMHLAGGVTFGRDPGADNATLLELERRIAGGELLGPRMKNSGFLEGKSPFSARFGGFIVENVEDAKARVRWYASHGFWGIKIYNSMPPDFVRPMAEEAHRLGLQVSGHVPAFMPVERAIRDGYDEIHHINQFLLGFLIDPLKEDTRTPFRFTALGERTAGLDLTSEPVRRMVKLMKARKVTLNPTMATFAPLLLARPGKASFAEAPWLDHMPMVVQRARRSLSLDVKPTQYALYDASWKRVEEALRMLHREGVTLVPGTDDTAGVMLHSELEVWVQAGIPAPATLTAATLGVARLLGVDRQVGSIAPGKLADLYLVDGDPTQDIRAIRKGRLVVTNGAYYYPDEIHAALGIAPFAPRAPVVAPAKPAPAK